jgi:uncharacterized membrane protein
MPTTKDGMDSQVETGPNGGICYAFGILFPLVYLIFTRRSMQKPFLRFHCFQCLILFALWAPFLISHPFGQAHISAIGFPLCFFAWLIAMIQARRRTRFHMPVIGAVAEWLTEK